MGRNGAIESAAKSMREVPIELLRGAEWKRILVTGNAGAGKTTLAHRIASELAIPFHSLDPIVWQTGWRKRPDAERMRRIHELIGTDAWVIDGVSAEAQSAADTVVFLDVTRRVCFWRVMKRNRQYLFRSRPELPPGCPEWRIVPVLLRIIWNFPARIRPRILEQAENERRSKQFFHVRTPADLKACIAAVIGEPQKVVEANPLCGIPNRERQEEANPSL